MFLSFSYLLLLVAGSMAVYHMFSATVGKQEVSACCEKSNILSD